jgi:tetratricopeptide (TPR) repeat protein
MPAKPLPSNEDGDDAGPRTKPRSGLQSPRVLIGLGLGVLLIAGGAFWFFSGPSEPPDVRLKRALRLLDQRRDREARNEVQLLIDRNYRDADFPGGIEFVLGIIAYRDVENWDVDSREARYLIALQHLRAADELALASDRRPEWSFAIGVSLFHTGLPDKASPHLELAVREYDQDKATAALLAAEARLFRQTDEDNAAAAEFIQVAIDELTRRMNEQQALSSPEPARLGAAQLALDRARLQYAGVLMRLNRKNDAEEVLAAISPSSINSSATGVLRAQALMASGEYADASALLRSLGNNDDFDRTYLPQAWYLIGVCAERSGQLDQAAAAYRRTTERFEKTHEGVAARLAAAECLRQLGRSEEALQMYAEFVRGIPRPEEFRNRWISLPRVRQILIGAWNAWVEQNFHQQAIALSDILGRLLPSEQALDLLAIAHQRWAAETEQLVASQPYDLRRVQLDDVRARWRTTAAVFARLAEVRSNASDVIEALWTSADQFARGHDFAAAAEQYTRLLTLRPQGRVATTLVRRGQCYLNLEKYDEALADFQLVVTHHPKDPAVYQANYLIAQCYFERQELQLAERHFRELLASPELAPTAYEWRRSLFSLGKLLHDFAELQLFHWKRRGTVTDPKLFASDEERVAIFQRFDESAALLSQYLDRYPSTSESLEVRFFRARCYQRAAQALQDKLAAAETENARLEYQRQIDERLKLAKTDHERLRATLRLQANENRLDELGQVLVRNTSFEIANCLFELRQYQDAINAYNEYAARYADDPDSISALMQVANAYVQMKKPSEALSTLAQARLILNQLSDSAFQSSRVNLNRNDWFAWINSEEAHVKNLR